MLRYLTVLMFVCLIARPVWANDGAYFMSGNQLIPIAETDISITREDLTLVRKGDDLAVTVAYQFENPGPEKTILVGFEAARPDGDVDDTPVNGGHPYMRDFTVKMNGRDLPYKVGATELSQGDLPDDAMNSGYYVYHFSATFKPGINKITHTYNFRLSGSVITDGSFDYILTAANRWAGEGIGDFNLSINMGEMVEYYLDNTFFDSMEHWKIQGHGKWFEFPDYYASYRGYGVDLTGSVIAIREGPIVFRKSNFRPEGELYLFFPSVVSYGDWIEDDRSVGFDAARHNLPFRLPGISHQPVVPSDTFSARVLKNYMFARRGYVFKDQALQDYFLRQPWYLPDPAYKADLAGLSVEEQKWYKDLKALSED